jgi:hypothetical protein
MPRARWIEIFFMPIVLTIVIVSWFSPVLVWLLASLQPDQQAAAPTPLSLAAVLLASIVVTRLALSGHVPYRRAWIVVGGLIAIGLLSAVTYRGGSLLAYPQDLLDWGDAISPEFTVIIAAALLWWRGILIGRSQTLVEENLEGTFLAGLSALGLLLYFNHLSPRLPSSELLTAILVFFTASLSMLMIVNIERARLHQSDPGFQFNRHWVLTIVGVIAAILLGAIGLTSLISPDTVRAFGESLKPAIIAVGSALVSVLTVIADLVSRLIEPLIPLLRGLLDLLLSFIERLARFLQDLGVQLNVDGALDSLREFLDSPAFLAITRGTLVTVVLIAFVLAVIYALVRSGLLSRRTFEETRESIASRELLLSQIKQLLRRLRPARRTERGLYLALTGDEARRTIRRAYQDFLEWARLRVRPRALHQTPNQYAERLIHLSPAQQEPLETLTALYLRARYADDELTPADTQTALAALDRLQQTPVIQSPLSET